jgi:predicted phage terminase large subunit-like protein
MQELDGEFVDSASLLKPEWLQKVDPARIPREGFNILAIDPAIVLTEGSDYTAFTLLRYAEGLYYVVRTMRTRTTIQQTVELTRQLYREEKIDALVVEDFGFQKALVEALNTAGMFAYSIKPAKDKVARFMPVLERFERGVILLSSALSDEFFDELCSFPSGQHDDQVDSLVYAIQMMDTMMGTEVSVIARR